MSLTEQLLTLKKQQLERTPEEVKMVMMNESKKLSMTDIVANAPKVGEKLKDFKLTNASGTVIDLANLREKGPVVVTFYRGGWCPYCNLQLRSYQSILKEIKDEGAELVAITPELPDSSLSTSEKNELEFEVVTDTNAKYAKELGLVFSLPESIRPIYKSFGIDVESHNGSGQFDLPLAATFIINSEGTITYAFIDTDYTLRADTTDIMNALKALKK